MTKHKSKIPGTSKKLQVERLASMSGNGSGEIPGVLPDIEWDEDNPPTIYACSQYIEHAPFCNGECPTEIADETLVVLINESRAWQRAGMSFQGIPAVYAGKIPIMGINVELFDLECKIAVLQQIVMDLVDVSEDELNVKFREFKSTALRNIREQNEAKVRRDRIAASLNIKPGAILGPDGNPL